MAKIADKCQDCTYYIKDPELAATTGQCHQAPPAIIIVPQAPAPKLVSMFPPTTGSNVGCSFFKKG